MPRENAQAAGATPNDICSLSVLPLTCYKVGCPHQIGQRIELGSHQTALFPHTRDHTIEEVEEETERHESQSSPEVASVRWSEAVAHRGHDRHDAAEAVHEGDQVGKVVGADQREVAGIGVVEETVLLVRHCEEEHVLACAIANEAQYG